MRHAHPRTHAWHDLSREEKQQRLGDLRQRQQHQIEREARLLRHLARVD